MTKSMTAFARTEGDGVAWEIRSVNQRYLDTNFKIPENFRFLEHQLREEIRKRLHRGKLDCLLRIDYSNLDLPELQINKDRLDQLRTAEAKINEHFPAAASPTSLDLLAWPGVLVQQEHDVDATARVIVENFRQTLEQLTEMRAREGAELARIILDKLKELEHIVSAVRSSVTAIQNRQQQKIRDRIAALDVEIDEGRLEQELVYLAQKADVAEELDRLETHVTEITRALSSSKPAGRRLDFLMQELNREANTLSSKAQAADTTISAVELKVIIEQMREQIQNIE